MSLTNEDKQWIADTIKAATYDLETRIVTAFHLGEPDRSETSLSAPSTARTKNAAL